jgi:hypothetical protein
MTTAFSQYLPHFALDAVGGIDLKGRVKPLGSAEPARRDIDAIAEAEARGRLEGAEAARIEFERRRTEDQSDFEFRLTDLKQKWVEVTAAAVSAQIEAGIAAIDASVSGHVACVLVRILDSALQQRAIAEVSQIVAAMIASGTAARIRITGPEALLARLRDQAASKGAAIEYVTVADKPDVSVMIDDTIIETQLAAWGERITAAVVGGSHG